MSAVIVVLAAFVSGLLFGYLVYYSLRFVSNEYRLIYVVAMLLLTCRLTTLIAQSWTQAEPKFLWVFDQMDMAFWIGYIAKIGGIRWRGEEEDSEEDNDDEEEG